MTATAAVVLLLGACAPSSPPASVETVTVPASPPATTSSTDPSTTSSSATPEAAGRCTTADLAVRLERRPADPRYPDQQRVGVVWTDTSGRACTMHGFGGVDLRGPDQQPYGPVDSLPRAGDDPATVRLEPGDSALTLLPFLADPPGAGSWTPDVAVVTPPDETHSRTLPWAFGPVARQDGATHPGTFIHAVTAF